MKNMKRSVKKGFGFGITSGIITTLGLMVGLFSSTNSKIVVLGGILMIAIADAMSDALGIHLSEELSGKHTCKEIWESTISTFTFKFVFATIFVIPILIFELQFAIIFSVFFGLLLLGIFSFFIAVQNKKNPLPVIAEHVVIATLVVIFTYFIGEFARNLS